MKVITEIVVSWYLLQRYLARFPKFEKKKKKRKKQKTLHEHILWSTKTCDKDECLKYFTIFQVITSENNDITTIT